MAIQITIRNVPNRVRDELAARAARAGLSMEAYLRQELERLASRPPIEQWLDRVREDKRRAGVQVSAEEILRQRDAGRR